MKVPSFAKLSMIDKNNIIVRLELRRATWLKAREAKLKAPESYLIVGDRPGPSAPKEAEYHHTPFYSTKHCSGWLNVALDMESIPEDRLVWINSADEYGDYYPIRIVKNLEPLAIIALGGNAAKWLHANNVKNVITTGHPQYWKRFHNSERYPLLDLLAPLKDKHGQ